MPATRSATSAATRDFRKPASANLGAARSRRRRSRARSNRLGGADDMLSRLRGLDHGALLGALKPGPRVRAGLRRVADAGLPPMSLDGRAAMEAGLSPEAWAKLVFLEAPVCDGCGAGQRPGDLGGLVVAVPD